MKNWHEYLPKDHSHLSVPLGKLYAESFVAFDTIRLLPRRNFNPTDLFPARRDDLPTVIDKAIHASLIRKREWRLSHINQPAESGLTPWLVYVKPTSGF